MKIKTDRLKIFNWHFNRELHTLHKTFKHKKIRFVYLDFSSLRTIFGYRKYKESIKYLEDQKIIIPINDGRVNKFKQRLYRFKPIEIPTTDIEKEDFGKECRNIIAKLKLHKKGTLSSEGDIVYENLKSTTIIKDGEEKELGGIVKEDNFSGRLHTEVSMMKRDERKNLRIDGERLVEIDMCQCQPTILADIIKQNYGSNKFTDIIESRRDIYDIVGSLWDNMTDRKKQKKWYCAMVNSKTSSRSSYSFSRFFPDTAKILAEMKNHNIEENPSKKDYSNVCWHMTRKEVKMFRDCWLNLSSKGIKFVTAHDAVFVKESQVDEAYDIMNDVLKQHLSIGFKLEVEYLNMNSKVA
jgi:hypothetical protein